MNWRELLTIEFGIRWKEGEADLWALELRDTVSGWRRMTGDEVNTELCAALRYIATFEKTPRADPKRSAAQYNCRDIRLWMHIYRKSAVKICHEERIAGVTPFSVNVKEHIRDLISDGKHELARNVAENPFISLHKYPDQADYTDEERRDVREWMNAGSHVEA